MEIRRHYFKWNTPEILRLKREYELLGLSIQEIAVRHNRSIRAILCKLEKENFIHDWTEAKGFEEFVISDPHLSRVKDSIFPNKEQNTEMLTTSASSETESESIEDSVCITISETESESETEFDSDSDYNDYETISREVSQDFQKLNGIEKSLYFLSNIVKNLFGNNQSKLHTTLSA
jgi:hypothetical protein